MMFIIPEVKVTRSDAIGENGNKMVGWENLSGGAATKVVELRK